MGPAILYSLFCILKKKCLTFGIINRKSMIVNEGGGNISENPGPVEWYMPSSIQCTTFIACCDALRLPAIRIDLNLHVIYISPLFMLITCMMAIREETGHRFICARSHFSNKFSIFCYIFFSYLFIYFRFENIFSLSFQANPPSPLIPYSCISAVVGVCVCVFICILYI